MFARQTRIPDAWILDKYITKFTVCKIFLEDTHKNPHMNFCFMEFLLYLIL
jgi:hypothetical protein